MSTYHPSKPSEEGKAPKVGLRRKFICDSRSAAVLRHAYARGEGSPPRRTEDRAREFRPRVPGQDRRRGTGGTAVNCPTTRYSTPAAAPRTGRGKSAPGGPNTIRSAPPSPPSPTTSPPTPGSRRPICGYWRPSSTSPGPTSAAGPATTRSPPGSIVTQGPSGGHYATSRTSATSVGNRPGRIPPVA